MDLGKMAMKGYWTFPQSSIITGTSPSDCLASYPEHSLRGSYLSAEVQSVYSTAPADWAQTWALLWMSHLTLSEQPSSNLAVSLATTLHIPWSCVGHVRYIIEVPCDTENGTVFPSVRVRVSFNTLMLTFDLSEWG